MTPQKSKRLRSKIWLSFTIDTNDPAKAICKVCNSPVSRGGPAGETQCTTNLWNHVKVKHPELSGELNRLRKSEEAERQRSMPAVAPADTLAIDGPADIWSLFIREDDAFAHCTECRISVPMGPPNKPTATLWSHTKAEHENTYALLKQNSVHRTMMTTFFADEFSQPPIASVSSRAKTSSVWTEFKKDPTNVCQVICKTCNTVVRRGTSVERLNTTNMRRHLQGSFHQKVVKGLVDAKTYPSKDSNPEPYLPLVDNVLAAAEDPCRSRRDISQDIKAYIPETVKKCELPAMPTLGDVIGRRRIDMAHSALVMQTLYEQQKKDVCCDFSLLLPVERNAQKYLRTRNAVRNGIGDICYYESSGGLEFKLHSCVAGATSDRLKTAIEFGNSSIDLKGVDEHAVQHFIEILYTGKLHKIATLRIDELEDIYNVANMLSTPVVTNYLMQEIPNLSTVHIEIPTAATGPDTASDFTSFASDGTSHVNTPHPDMQTNTTPEVQKIIALQQESAESPKQLESRSSPVILETNGASDSSVASPGNQIPKVNKRKNYLPVSSDMSRKKAKFEPDVDGKLDTSASCSGLPSETCFADKACQASGRQEPSVSDRYIKINVFPVEPKSPIMNIIKTLRYLACEAISVLPEHSTYQPDLDMETEWENLLHQYLPTDSDDHVKNFCHIAAGMSRRCWDLFQEVTDMADVPTDYAAWSWIIGLEEESVFSSMIVLMCQPYNVASKLVPIHVSIPDQMSPLANNKRTQTVSEEFCS